MNNLTLVTKDGGRKTTHALLLAASSTFLRVLLEEMPLCTGEQGVIILPDFSEQEVQLCLQAIIGAGTQGVDKLLMEGMGIELEQEELGDKSVNKGKNDNLSSIQRVEEEVIKGCDQKYDEVEAQESVMFEGLELSQNSTLNTSRQMNQDQDNSKWNCNICRHGPDSVVQCFHKEEKNHKQGSNWNCLQCSKRFQNINKFKVHLRYHKRGIVCDICGKYFHTKFNLSMHHLKVHTSEEVKKKEKRFICKICEKGFYHKVNLRNHEFIHLDHKSFSCNTCGNSYKTKVILYKHKKNVHEGLFVCKTCDKKFYTQGLLSNHENIHLEHAKYFCSLCKYGAKTNAALQQHTKIKHEGKYVVTDKQREDARARGRKWRAMKKEKNGGTLRSAEEKVKFNEYMKKHQARKRMKTN